FEVVLHASGVVQAPHRAGSRTFRADRFYLYEVIAREIQRAYADSYIDILWAGSTFLKCSTRSFARRFAATMFTSSGSAREASWRAAFAADRRRRRNHTKMVNYKSTALP